MYMARTYTPIQQQYADFTDIIKCIRNISDMFVIKDKMVFIHSLDDGAEYLGVIHDDIDVSAYGNMIDVPNRLYEFLSKSCKTNIEGVTQKITFQGDEVDAVMLRDIKKEVAYNIPYPPQDVLESNANGSCYKLDINHIIEMTKENNSFVAFSAKEREAIHEDGKMVAIRSNGKLMAVSKCLFPLSKIDTEISVRIIDSNVDSRTFMAIFKEELQLIDLYSVRKFLDVTKGGIEND